MATHFVVFYAATAGSNGPLLGSDEEDIVIMQFLVWDAISSKVLTEQQYIVQPNSVDVNENLLSEQCIEEYRLSEEQVKSGQSLETVLDSFDTIVSKICGGDSSRVIIVTDGQLHLRQVLHPKAIQRNLSLPEIYNSFYDIKKEFRSFYRNDDSHTINDMVEYLDIKAEIDEDLATRSVRDMGKLVARMLEDGHRFVLPETITIRLEPGICLKGEEVDNSCVVRARGLPWQSSDLDIAKFFRGLNISKGGVALCLSPQGRRNGEALVRFVNSEHRDMALKRHKHHIANRYIEVYKATGEDFVSVAGGNNNEAQQFLSRGGQVIIRMRGLPYDCTAKQVYEFFEGGDNGCYILDGTEGVLFVRKPDGRATGDAFVLFAAEEDSTKALSKHREIIGSRYIELFRSTTAEVQQVLNRSMDPRTYETQQPLIAQLPQMSFMPPQHIITSGTRKDCIRLRGLPYEAQVEHVLEFLGEHAKSIVFRGVHMVYNAQGQPSGEAFIQMDSEHSAFLAAQQRHHKYMIFGKKQRYIEVFQCSGEDMNLVLSGGLTPQRPILSPGMLMWDTGAAATAAGGGLPALPPAGHHTPALMPPGITRPPLPGALPPGIPHPPNAAMIPGMPQTTIKPPEGSLLPVLHSPLLSQQIRPPLTQHHAEMPNTSQAQHSQLLSPMKTHVPAPGFHPALIGQYGEMQVAHPGAGMIFLQHGAKFATPPQMPTTGIPPPMFVAVSSAQDMGAASTSIPPKLQTAPPLLPMPYPVSLAVAANMRAAGKRSFEQAFTSDSNNALRAGVKRPAQMVNRNATALIRPPINRSHVPASHINTQHMTTSQTAASHCTQINQTQLMSAQLAHTMNPPPSLNPAALNPAALNPAALNPAALNPATLNPPPMPMNPPLLHTFYPPPPVFPSM